MKVCSQSNFSGIYKQNMMKALINLLNTFIGDKNQYKNRNAVFSSYEVSLLIAKAGKPHSVVTEELILLSAKEIHLEYWDSEMQGL
jgi:hypothetical protein